MKFIKCFVTQSERESTRFNLIVNEKNFEQGYFYKRLSVLERVSHHSDRDGQPPRATAKGSFKQPATNETTDDCVVQ